MYKETYAYRVLPFGFCNALGTFQQAILGIFSNLIHTSTEIYMDYFKVYNLFEEDLKNIEICVCRC